MNRELICMFLRIFGRLVGLHALVALRICTFSVRCCHASYVACHHLLHPASRRGTLPLSVRALRYQVIQLKVCWL